ncbi:MAG: diguanylate cyclase [Janthinobacterium lividum]
MAPIPANETQRLDALYRTHILDTLPSEAFDDLTRLAAHLCGVPIAAVSLVDSERQWFKSVLGMDDDKTPRRDAFCSHTILQTEVLIVPDASEDTRFADNPMVTGDPHIRFYAGAPLITAEGFAIGSLCIVDRVPRQLSDDQKTALQILSRQAVAQIELTRRVAEQEQLMVERAAAQEVLQQSEIRLLEAQRVAKIGSWEYDVESGHITWSAEMFRLLGFDPAQDEPDYETLMAHYHPDDVAMHTEITRQALDDGLPYEFDISIQIGSGLVRWGHAMGQAARDNSGRIVRLFGTVMDITERKQVEEENARMAAIIESSHDAVLGTTLDGTLVSWNASAQRLYGYAEGEIIGQHASVLTPPDQHGLITSIIQTLQRGEACENLELRSRRKDGAWIDTVLTFSPIRAHAGEIVGVAAIGHDVTAQRSAEEAVRRSEACLAEAQRIAHIGSWERDHKTNEITFSQEMYRLFDLDMADGMPPHAELLAKYHPDDVDGLQASVAQARIDGKAFATDLRIVRPNGQLRWCHVVGEPLLDDEGQPTRFVGTMMDTTERVMVEERFRVLFEFSSEAHFLLDSTGIIDCNQAAMQILRCSDKSKLLAIHPILMSPEYQPDGRLSAEKGLEMLAVVQESGTHRFEWTHCRMDGEEFPTEIILTPVTLSEKPAMLSVWHDLTERKLAEQRIQDYAVVLELQKNELETANQELSNLATTDGLTGLKNHRAFQERLAGDCEIASRHHTPLSLLLMDVDNFKQFNDTFGHPAGDAVLKQVAQLLGKTMRECDFVARYGGEEFVVILPLTDQAGAVQAAERCRLAIEGAGWSCRPVTASFGIATFSLDCTGSAALITAADEALCAAKSNGRNQVMHARSFCMHRP